MRPGEPPALVLTASDEATAQLKAFFAEQAKELSAELSKRYGQELGKATSSDGHPDPDQLLQALLLKWQQVGGDLEALIEDVYAGVGTEALTELNFTDEGMFGQVNDAAKAFAESRSAELVTLISDSTRERLKVIIANAFERGLTPAQLADVIENSSAFSDARAELIARTEMAMAQVQGAIEGMKATGLDLMKRSMLSADHVGEDECDDAADEGLIPLDEDFSTGDEAPPFHPNCFCAIDFVEASEENND